MRGTIQINSDKKKVFLPELTCDFFIGILKPNQMTIDNDSYLIDNQEAELNENEVVYANLNYFEKTCTIIEKNSFL